MADGGDGDEQERDGHCPLNQKGLVLLSAVCCRRISDVPLCGPSARDAFEGEGHRGGDPSVWMRPPPPTDYWPGAGLSLRGKQERKKERVRDTNRNERSRGRSLLHGHDMGKTQDHRNSVEQWWAVGGGWRLAVGGCWRLAVVLGGCA